MGKFATCGIRNTLHNFDSLLLPLNLIPSDALFIPPFFSYY